MSYYHSKIKKILHSGKYLNVFYFLLGTNSYKHCRAFVEDIILVSDDEIIDAVSFLYQAGLVVEPSGAAAFAALRSSKIPDVKGRRVVVVITGGNVTPQELIQLIKT